MSNGDWTPATPDVVWPAYEPYLDGEKWPEKITLRAWERNEAGERRIKAEAVYHLTLELRDGDAT